MARNLDLPTLTGFARECARQWLSRDIAPPPGQKLFRGGPSWVVQSLYNLHFKDEFQAVHALLMDEYLGKAERAGFEASVKDIFTPRTDAEFHRQLKYRLALSPEGDHIEGAIGLVQIGTRLIARRPFEVESPASIARRKALGLPLHVAGRTDRETIWKQMWQTWPVYAGEGEERCRLGEGVADPLPYGAIATDPWGNLPKAVGANVTNFSAESIIAALDAIADKLDEGDAAANIRIRTGSQPADPDATEDGTLLATLTCSDPAVDAAVDDTDGTCSATFDTITDDSAADATGTAGYGRAAATGTGADDHIDGNCGTNDEAFVFNTVSFVSGSTVSITSAVIGQSQGSTAT